MADARANSKTVGTPQPVDAIQRFLEDLPAFPRLALPALSHERLAPSASAQLERELQHDPQLVPLVLAIRHWRRQAFDATADERTSDADWLCTEVAAGGLAHWAALLHAPGSLAAIDLPGWMLHAAAVGLASARLAASSPVLGVSSPLALLAGFLHDVGKLALAALFPRAYERIIRQVSQSRGDIADLEDQHLHVDHCIVGRELLANWGSAPPLREVAWLHSLAAGGLPASLACGTLVQLVHLADLLAREADLGFSGNFLLLERSDAVAARLGLSSEALQAATQTLDADARRLGASLSAPPLAASPPLKAERANATSSDSPREPATLPRALAALAAFHRALPAQAGVAQTLRAIEAAAAQLLDPADPRPRALAVHIAGGTIELSGDSLDDPSIPCPGKLCEWLESVAASARVMRVSEPLRLELAQAGLGGEPGTAGVLPLISEARPVGALLLSRLPPDSQADALAALAEMFARTLAAALAQRDLRRLSDELAEANRRLQQSQAEQLRTRTLSMIAEMAAGAGHELNSPLAVISGRAQMLLEQQRDSESRRALETIHAKAHDCSRIVSDLMEFARPRPPRIARVAIAELLDRIREEWLQAAGLPAGRVIVAGPGHHPDLPAGLADAAQLREVLMELLQNATDATAANRGSITLRWAVTSMPAPVVPTTQRSRRRPPERAAGAAPAIELIVEDSGCGMGPAILQRAFDPFFSHRVAGRGRGLGLARAYRIIEAHNGRIWIVSRPNEGTRVHVLLPAASKPADEPR